MVGITRMLDPGPQIAPGIHPTTVLEPDAEIGEGLEAPQPPQEGAPAEAAPGGEAPPEN